MASIALLGYGRMGQAVAAQAEKRGHEIIARIDQHNIDYIPSVLDQQPQVVIEFTHPESVLANINQVISAGIPLVVGTTGWYEHIPAIKSLVDQQAGSLLFASNFSVGVNVLFKLNQYLAELMNRYEDYDPYVEEQHHRHKKDAPSGTAKTLSQQILAQLTRKTAVVYEQLRDRAPVPEELSVGAIRAGEIIGKHTVAYHSPVDTIKLEHTAHNREGFALGAVLAAEWLLDKKGFYEFKDII